MLGIVLPVSILAIALAITFAYLFVKYKRRYAVSSLSDARVQPTLHSNICTRNPGLKHHIKSNPIMMVGSVTVISHSYHTSFSCFTLKHGQQ